MTLLNEKTQSRMKAFELVSTLLPTSMILGLVFY